MVPNVVRPGTPAPRPARAPAEESSIPGTEEILERLALPAGARILALGETSLGLTERLAALGHDVQRSDAIPAARGEFDVVLAPRLLDRERWGRWALQRIHRLLKDRGRLHFSAANTLEAASLIDPGYVGGKLRKQLAKLVPSRVAADASSRRTYTGAQLARMLDELGFRIEARWCETAGGQPAPSVFGARHVLVCERLPSLFGASDERPYPDPTLHRRRFERAHRAFLANRERWCRRHRVDATSPPTSIRLEELAGRVVLVLSPHPDDELIGCGGTLLRAIGAGARVVVVQATDGSASVSLEGVPELERRRRRLEEAEAVARAAGFERTIFWEEDNRAFGVSPARVTELRRLLDELRPALVLTPFLADAHPDHLTLDRLLAGALREEDACTILQYEVWGLVPANLCCDVTDRMPELEELLLRYETAMMVDDYVHFCAARNHYHAIRSPAGSGFVEVFHATSAARFLALAGERRADSAGYARSAPH